MLTGTTPQAPPLSAVGQDMFGGKSALQLYLKFNGDPGAFRPFKVHTHDDPVSYMTVNHGGARNIVANADATLLVREWIALDKAVMDAAKPRLRLVMDLESAGLVINLPNSFAHTVYEYQRASDISAATTSMDPLRMSEMDRPVTDRDGVPLPIIHKDSGFTARDLAISRNGNYPLDTSTLQLAGRRVAEEAEKYILGTNGTFTYSGKTIYGYTNHPYRITASVTAGNAGGWTGGTLLTQILGYMASLRAAYHYGPYMVYVGTSWDTYLDGDFSTLKGDNTLRQRIKMIEGITDVRTSDYLSGYTIVVVQMTSDTVQLIRGMALNTVQWPEEGGFATRFKTMMMAVPLIKADHNNLTGIVHATV